MRTVLGAIRYAIMCASRSITGEARCALMKIDDVPAGSTVVEVGHSLPAWNEYGSNELLCGRCNQVLGKLSAERLYEILNPAGDLVVQCPCGALNSVPDRRVR